MCVGEVAGWAVLLTRCVLRVRVVPVFCFQCEQTEKGTGCTTIGVCGKDPTTAAMQDLLIHALEGLSEYAHAAREAGAPENAAANAHTLKGMFATLTNVNFDAARFSYVVVRHARARKWAT